jgi:hypothetical protein
MGTVSLTTTEYVGDVSRSESIYFECFEDFLQYEEYKRKREFPVEPQILEPEVEGDTGWIEWKGGECPVDEDVRVEVQLRDGDFGKCEAGGWLWTWSEDYSEGDIIRYRVTEEEE